MVVNKLQGNTLQNLVYELLCCGCDSLVAKGNNSLHSDLFKPSVLSFSSYIDSLMNVNGFIKWNVGKK